MTIVKTEFFMMQGKLNEARMSLNELEAMAQSGLSKSEQLTTHLQARFRAASGDSEKALEILERLEQLDRERKSARRLMGVHLTQAMAYQRKGDQTKANHAIETAIRLAAPQGYRVLFIPHPGRPTRALLESARAVAPDFVNSILKVHTTAEENASLLSGLPEPLSAQEIRVLKLVAMGKSNQEIADELVISAGTAKWHVHNILQKLEVSNRAQAIARARELGIA
jgi:LuxR family maltose regulon positive regulatory protein